MYNAVQALLATSDFTVVESFQIAGRPARFASTPRYLFDTQMGNYIDQEFKPGLWNHQAEALIKLGEGRNVVVSTGTASGKSLIFRALVLHKALSDSSTRAIVFYPQRALIEDQLQGWRAMARTLGFDDEVIGRIDGSIRRPLRDEILQRSRVVIMTPDVCQAWLMARLAMPIVRDFVGDIATLVMTKRILLKESLAATSHFSCAD